MRLLIITILLFIGSSSNARQAKKKPVPEHKGIASYYHKKFEGRKTATGEIFDNGLFTAASNKLKLGVYVKVTNLRNGNKVYVRINDRMAATNPRLIDLTSAAAEVLNFVSNGITKVKIEVVSAEEGRKGIMAEYQIKALLNNEYLVRNDLYQIH